ncbi:MAG TPA: polysaccharide biosynthesis/export family protein [Terriglobales bacterium]|nr:polysaccharide biosynthesis/export family protein [Terriglobales bacterium]
MTCIRFLTSAILLLSLGVAGAAQGASALPPPSVPSAAALIDSTAGSSSATAAAPADFQVGPGDVLSVTIYNMPSLSSTVMVAPDGSIRLPFAPILIHAQGDTADQIATELSSQLKSRQIFVDPQLTVTVVQVRSRPIVISGGVRNATVLQAVEPIDLLDALIAAGGVSDGSATNVLVRSPNSAGRPGTTLDLPLDRVLADGGEQYNPRLAPGDIVQVLPGGRVYISGDVKNPGAIPLTPGQQLHITQALALVGNWNRGAGAGKATITRRDPGGLPPTVIPVDLPAIMSHKKPDLVLQANDLLYIPGDAKRQIALTAATGFSTAVIFGLGYLIVR